MSLLANGPAPSARAARIKSTLQRLWRLWRLAPDGLGFVDEAWPRLPTDAAAVAQPPGGLDPAPLLAPAPAGSLVRRAIRAARVMTPCPM